MGWLPEVEDLVTVLNWGEECRYTVRYEEYVKRDVQWQV